MNIRFPLPILAAAVLALQGASASAAVQVSGPLTDPVLLAGFDTLGVRFRQLNTGGSKELYVGHNDLGTGANRAERDLTWAASQSFTIQLVDGTLSASIAGGAPLAFADTLGASGASADLPFDTLQIGLRDNFVGGGTFSLTGLTLTGTDYSGTAVSNAALGDFAGVDGGAFRFFTVTGIDFRQNFLLSGTFNRAGAFGGSAEANRVDFTFGNGPIEQPAVPEPATWALLIAGFGAVGIAARRRRTQAA